MSKFKKFSFIVLSNIFLFLLIEIILTFFFIFHKTNYYGPLARLFLFEKKIPVKTVMYDIKYSKKTGMHIPGNYNFNDIKHTVNKYGFIGKEVDIKNESGCRLIALGGSTTAFLPTVGITLEGASSGDFFNITSITGTQFVIEVRDSSNNLKNLNFRYTAIGFGKGT